MSKYTKKRDIVVLYALFLILLVLSPVAAIMLLVVIGYET